MHKHNDRKVKEYNIYIIVRYCSVCEKNSSSNSWNFIYNISHE